MTDVIDGDTIDVARGDTRLDGPPDRHQHARAGECWYDEATEALTELVGSGPVWLTVDTTDIDQFGRALRYVFNADRRGRRRLLVEQGAAIARSYPPDTANDDRYALLQEAARLQSRAVGARRCGAARAVRSRSTVLPSTSASRSIPTRPATTTPTSTTSGYASRTPGRRPRPRGWIVRDESSSHRYTFTDLVARARRRGHAVHRMRGRHRRSATGAAPIRRCGTTGVTRSSCSTRPATSPPRGRTERRRHRSSGQPANPPT